MLTRLKKRVQEALVSEALFLHRIGFTANAISLIGFLLALSSSTIYAARFLSFTRMFAAAVLLLASGFCDALDGVVARTCGQASIFGGFLDSLLDRYADAFVFSGIIVGGLCNIYVGLGALAGSLLVSYARARAEAAGVKTETIGVAERAERIIILAASSLAAVAWMPALNLGVLLLAFLANLTVLQRGIHVYKSLKGKKEQV
jgi:archaetidylinositol phosphate synthase